MYAIDKFSVYVAAMAKKIVIIGGVAGGMTAATRLRRMDETAEIIVLEMGQYVSYANCGLAYHVGGVIADEASLLVQTPEKIQQRYNIDVRVFSQAVKINPQQKTVNVKELRTDKQYTLDYDNLLLSPGSSPVVPKFEGYELADNIFTIDTVPDAVKIKKFVKDRAVKQAVIVGGGFVGLEMVENLHNLGIKVTIVEMLEQLVAGLDFEMANVLHKHLASQGVNVILKDGVQSFAQKGKQITLASGKILESDLTILAIGVKPNSELAKEAGLQVTEKGQVLVDQFMQTSDPAIYAVGDVVQVRSFISGQPTYVPMAWNANRQGRIAADNICGRKTEYYGAYNTGIVRIFDLQIGITGLNEKALQTAGMEYQVVHAHPLSHAGYYPGASALNMKMLFSKDGLRIFGAQVLGFEAVDKHIDIMATAILTKMNVWDLQNIQLAYSPSFSSAKSPVNMLGYMAGDICENLVQTVQWHEVKTLQDAKNVYFLDIRDPEELVLGKIASSQNISLNLLRNKLDQLPKDQLIVVYCQVGLRGYIAARLLVQKGFQVKNLDGGYQTYADVYEDAHQILTPIHETGAIHFKLPQINQMDYDETFKADLEINAQGLQCPGPLVQLSKAIKQIEAGQIIKISVTDFGFMRDVGHWSESTGNILLKTQEDEGVYTAFVQKGTQQIGQGLSASNLSQIKKADNVNLIVFSGDLDKALAAFIISNGAVAFGKKVKIFFTFWGLNILRKDNFVNVKKGFLEKMFGMMMPRGASKLGISKMNMGGMGGMMIRYIMKKKNVETLEQMIKRAKDGGVELIACTMSMDIMGIHKEELLDDLVLGGVATYLANAEDNSINLFI